MIPDVETIVDLARRHADAHGDRPFLSWLGDGKTISHELSYAALDLRARALAVRLRAAMLSTPAGAEDRAAMIVVQHGPEFVVALFACMYAGVAAVPAYPPKKNESSARLLALIENSGASLVLTDESLFETLGTLGLGTPIVPIEDGDDAIASSWSPPAISPESVAFIQYTSGSTGNPKGVVVTHGSLLGNLRMIEEVMNDGVPPTMVGWLPMFHDMGLVGNLLHPFSLGGRSILMSPLTFMVRPIRWLEAITRFRATISGGPNFAYEMCLARITPEQRQQLDLSSWKVAFNGAEPVRAATVTRFTQVFASTGFRPQALCPCYGMAECGLFITGVPMNRPPSILRVDAERLQHGKIRWVDASRPSSAASFVSSGTASLDSDVAIVDPISCRRLPEREVGEIWVHGPHVAREYKGQAALSEAAFRAQCADDRSGRRYLRTGDLGFVYRSELFVSGRIKDLIIVNGLNHYPQDIEASVGAAHPALAGCVAAAFSLEHENEERVVVVVAVGKTAPRSMPLDAVSRAIVTSVTRNHGLDLLDLVIVGSRLPVTSSNKIRRSLCRQMYLGEGFELTFVSTRRGLCPPATSASVSEAR